MSLEATCARPPQRSDLTISGNDILTRLKEGSMPCDGAWPAEKVEVFQRWTDTAAQP